MKEQETLLRLGCIKMERKENYTAISKWSEEDAAFIATTPEFPYLSGFGDTRGEALRELNIAVDLAVSVMKEDLS